MKETTAETSTPEIRNEPPRRGFIRSHPEYLAGAFLVLITLIVFGRVVSYDFVRYDDDVYILLNQIVQTGLSRMTVIWSFTHQCNSNWHPLTMVSYLADFSLYGLRGGGFHLTNLILHLGSVLLLFAVLRRMTGSTWRSAFVAALFAIHPLHVESVAWIAERKDVLSTFFWMLTMLMYVRYVERPGRLRYLYVVAAFALGLMSKSMLVSLPIVLLLMDYWPLRRFRSASGQGTSLIDLIREKAPLFAMSLIMCWVTYTVQSNYGSTTAAVYPLGVRLANAVVAYMEYIAKMVYPADLTVLYMHPGANIPTWHVVLSWALLTSATALIVWKRRSMPCVFVGWLWYLVTLVPVIGLIQVGMQGMADRYTYVPLIGLFIAIAWGVPEILRPLAPQALWRRSPASLDAPSPPRPLTTGLAAAGVLVVVVSMMPAWKQVGYWEDSVTLMSHAVEVTPDNKVVQCNLGLSYTAENRTDEAIAAYERAIALDPYFAQAHHNLAVALYFNADYARSWQEAHISERLGIMPPRGFLDALRAKMPEPSE